MARLQAAATEVISFETKKHETEEIMKTKVLVIAAALFLTSSFFSVYLKGHYDGSTGKKP